MTRIKSSPQDPIAWYASYMYTISLSYLLIMAVAFVGED